MIKIDLKVGDTILTGKWKNKKVVVKSIDTDEFGSPTVNGKSILKIRIPKLYQKESTMKENKKLLMKNLIKETYSDENFKTMEKQIKELDILKSVKEKTIGDDSWFMIMLKSMPSQDELNKFKKYWESDYKITVSSNPLKLNVVLKESIINEDVFEAYFRMDKWMPQDQELQLEWIKLLQKKNVKEIERFIDQNADYQVLKKYLGGKSVADLAKYILKAHSHLDSKEFEYWR